MIRARTGLVCKSRSFRQENGVAVLIGRTVLSKAQPRILEDAEQPLSNLNRALIISLREQWCFVDNDLQTTSKEFKAITKSRDDLPLR